MKFGRAVDEFGLCVLAYMNDPCDLNLEEIIESRKRVGNDIGGDNFDYSKLKSKITGERGGEISHRINRLKLFRYLEKKCGSDSSIKMMIKHENEKIGELRRFNQEYLQSCKCSLRAWKRLLDKCRNLPITEKGKCEMIKAAQEAVNEKESEIKYLTARKTGK